jgi:hypothetical protein
MTKRTALDNPVLAEHAAEIRRLGKQTVENIVEIGRRLVECRDRHLDHGQWLPWLEREFQWSRQTADNFIHVYEARSKLPKFGNLNLPVSGLYLLAAPSTPEAAKTEIIERAEAGESIPVAEVKRVVESHKGRQQPAKRTIAPHRKAMAERMARDIQARKIEDFHRGNVPTKEGRAQQEQILDAGLRALAKEAHPDHGGSTEQMQRLNAARDDLKSDLSKAVVIDWWKQNIPTIAAQMAKNLTIKQITELCAIANGLRKTKAAATPSPARDDISTGETAREDTELEDLRATKRRLEIENTRLRSEVEDLRRELAERQKPSGDPVSISEFQATIRKWEDTVETQKNIIRNLQNENASLRAAERDNATGKTRH